MKKLLVSMPCFLGFLSVIVFSSVLSGIPSVKLRDAAVSNVWFLLAFAGHCMTSVYLSSIMYRYTVRLLPMKANGKRSAISIVFLVVFILFISIPVRELLFTALPLMLRPRYIGFWGGWIEWALEKYIWFTPILISFGVAAVLMLVRHLKPKAWKKRPYIFFLRRFSGLSSNIALYPLAKGAPKGVKVAFLVGPMSDTTSWDPSSIGLSGLLSRTPFGHVPICLQSHDDEWEANVRSIATKASAIIIDVSALAPSIEAELRIIDEIGAQKRTLYICSVDARNNVKMLTTTSEHVRNQTVTYSISWMRAVPSIAVAGLTMVGGVYTALGVLFVLILALYRDIPDITLRGTIPTFLIILSVLIAIPLIRKYVMRPTFERVAENKIRDSVRTMCIENLNHPS